MGLKGVLAAGAAVLAVASSNPAWAATHYSVTKLSLGGSYGDARSINDLGQVVGSSNLAGDRAGGAFLYSGGVITDLGRLGTGNSSVANAINNAGEIVGYSSTGAPNTIEAFYYDGTMHGLGRLAGPHSYAQDINESGMIVGMADTVSYGGDYLSVIYDRTGIQSTFGQAPDVSFAYAVNNAGQVAGIDVFPDRPGYLQAYTYQSGVQTSLNSLVGATSGWDLNYAVDINDAGQIVGLGSLDGHAAGYVFQNGVASVIPDIEPGSVETSPNAINEAGDIVGVSFVSEGPHAFLYSGGTTLDLNDLIDPDLGWVLRTATDINALGQIVGQGLIDGQQQAYLLTPVSVPEPATWALMLSGMLGAGAVLRRQRALQPALAPVG